MHTPLTLVFYFILPEKGGGRDAQKGGLTTSNWTKWRKNMDKINASLLYSTVVNKKLYFFTQFDPHCNFVLKYTIELSSELGFLCIENP